MFDTYYLKLTMVHPKLVTKMNPQLGLVIAETATTGKFFFQELEWKSLTDVNVQSSMAYHQMGNLKIAEPLGCRLLDYLRLAAAKLGIINWLDARYFLEVDLRAENYDKDEFHYIFPILINKWEIRNISEKGTEYNATFAMEYDYVQSDILQQMVDTITVKDVSTVGEYFQKYARELELQQFKLAEARQKAGSKKGGGGDHPAAGDPYHDEFYFILDPKIKSYELKTKEIHDPGKDTSYENKSRQNRETNKKIDVTAKKGTTIMAQIFDVLSLSKGTEDLMPGKERPQTPDAQGASKANKKNNESMLQKIHQFYRVATHTVYKKYDHVRGRYAVKNFYVVYLVDQPNMYQFPDEIDLINEDKFAKTLLGRLDEMIRKGYLRKSYYHWYTGMNTDVIKMTLGLNSQYFLPGIPQYWTDYGETTDGRLEDAQKYNWDRKKTPYTYGDSGPADPVFPDHPQQAPYLEDIPFSQVSRYLLQGYPQLRPRIEPTEIIKHRGDEHIENTFLVQKIYDVLASPFDLMQITLEIIGDPWWIGEPNFMNAGLAGIDKIDLPDRVKTEVKDKLKGPDPDFNSRTVAWPNYGKKGQNFYAGPAQIYYCAQLPSNDTVDDLMIFDMADTISGIYQVGSIINTFRDGKWTQTLECKRNNTIPSKIIPRFVNGQYTTFENYISQVLSQSGGGEPEKQQQGGQNVNDQGQLPINKISEERTKELENANLSSQNPNFGAEDRVTQNTVSSDPSVQRALDRRKELESKFPAPTVNNPVDRANELVKQGISKEQAYSQAKKEYINQLNSKFEHLDGINKQAFADAGVQKYKSYSPETMTALALEKSNNGGLEDWKKNTEWKGPATLNNPGGLGHDVRTGRYNKYENFDQGVTAINDYYNYGVGVPASRKGPDKYLLPSGFTGTAAPNKTGNTELRYIDNASKGRTGG